MMVNILVRIATIKINYSPLDQCVDTRKI